MKQFWVFTGINEHIKLLETLRKMLRTLLKLPCLLSLQLYILCASLDFSSENWEIVRCAVHFAFHSVMHFPSNFLYEWTPIRPGAILGTGTRRMKNIILWFSQDICPIAGLLSQKIVLFLIFKELSILFSIVAESTYSPKEGSLFSTSSSAFVVYRFFWWWPFRLAWGDTSL